MPTKFCASASDIVVLPSPGMDEVMAITFGGWSTFDNNSDVRRLRMASAAAEVGRWFR